MISYKQINDKQGFFVIKDCTAQGLSQEAKPEIRVVADRNVLSVYANADKPFAMDKISVILDYAFKSEDKIYVNGYQSWTDSFEYSVKDKMYAPAKFMQAILKGPVGRTSGISNAGDIPILEIKNRTGKFYGFSYGYVRRENEVDIFGSLSERRGYTVIEFDCQSNGITVSVDLKGKKFESGDNLLLQIGLFKGQYNKAFDEYFNAMGIEPKERPLLTGYTTWYNYYNKINIKIVERDLEALSKLPQQIDIFQVDDGYQKAIGDWLNTDISKFPDGMKPVAQKIHSKKMLAGLWLAPFAATKESFIYKEHQDWLVKDEKGKLLKAGANWGGFYSLDIYNPQAREYIKKVFDTILRDWGYDLVKLDFLYCACIIPMHGKSRGEIMCEAMDFLRECCKDKLILGCGVPLAPAFGKVDYCRIGPDISLEWGKRRFDSREGVSIVHAMLNSVFRRHLDGRAFGNDPDVFLLRDTNIRLNNKQKAMLAKCNKLCGKVLFTSDNVDDYDESKHKLLSYVFDRNIPEILKADFDNGIFKVEYKENSVVDVFTADMKY